MKKSLHQLLSKNPQLRVLAFHGKEASFTTKRRVKWRIEETQEIRMPPPPIEPHNHSQTHLKLSRQLPLQASFSAGLRAAKSLKTLWTRTLLSLESLSRMVPVAPLNMQKLYARARFSCMQRLLQEKLQTPFANLISGLNMWPCSCSCA